MFVMAYHRTPTSILEGNDGAMSYSVHLAVHDEGGPWQALNKNRGVAFARNTDGGLDEKRSCNLIDPCVVRLATGGFAVLAVRTRLGLEDADESGSYGLLVFHTHDLIEFEERGIMTLGDIPGGIRHPFARFDANSDSYLVSWQTRDGKRWCASFERLDAGTSPVNGPWPMDCSDSSGNKVDECIRWLGLAEREACVDQAPDIEGFNHGYAVALDEEESQALIGRFGRVHNIGHMPLEPLHMPVGGDPNELGLACGAVTLNYSDGSHAVLPVEWDLSGVDPLTPGDYEVTGQVAQRIYDPKVAGKDYTAPFAEERADPDLFRFDWTHRDRGGQVVTEHKYLFTATNDVAYSCRLPGDPPRPFLMIRMADSIEGMADCAGDPSRTVDKTGLNPLEHILLEAGAPLHVGDGETTIPITGSFWAPEIHRIAGRLSILFGPGTFPDGNGQRSAIMRLKQDSEGFDLDPAFADNWETPRVITFADGATWTGSYDDMTYFEDETGQGYYVWWDVDRTDGPRTTVIAEVDSHAPWRVLAQSCDDQRHCCRIEHKEYAWETCGPTEGYYVVEHEGMRHLIYSTRRVDGRYVMGMLTSRIGNPVLSEHSWSKSNAPVLATSLVDGEWEVGPGHAMFAKDEWERDLLVFHRYSHVTRADGFFGGRDGDGRGFGDVGDSYNGRDAYIRRVHWAADGHPVLDMTSDEELSESNRMVRAVVQVR